MGGRRNRLGLFKFTNPSPVTRIYVGQRKRTSTRFPVRITVPVSPARPGSQQLEGVAIPKENDDPVTPTRPPAFYNQQSPFDSGRSPFSPRRSARFCPGWGRRSRTYRQHKSGRPGTCSTPRLPLPWMVPSEDGLVRSAIDRYAFVDR